MSTEGFSSRNASSLGLLGIASPPGAVSSQHSQGMQELPLVPQGSRPLRIGLYQRLGKRWAPVHRSNLPAVDHAVVCPVAEELDSQLLYLRPVLAADLCAFRELFADDNDACSAKR